MSPCVHTFASHWQLLSPTSTPCSLTTCLRLAWTPSPSGRAEWSPPLWRRCSTSATRASLSSPAPTCEASCCQRLSYSQTPFSRHVQNTSWPGLGVNNNVSIIFFCSTDRASKVNPKHVLISVVKGTLSFSRSLSHDMTRT